MRKKTITALTIGVLVTLVAARIVDLWLTRAQTIQTASNRAANLAFILSEYVRELFGTADASLRQLALQNQRIGGARASDAEWAASLAAAKAGLTGIGSISVTDADGVIRHSTQPAIVGQSRSDEYLFKALASRNNDDLIIDTPFLTPIEPRQYLIPLGRRLATPAGAFDGTVVAVLMPAAPRGFFQTVDVGRRGAVWVFHPDGVLMFREPSPADPVGQPAAANPVFAAAKTTNASGILEDAIEPGGPVLLSAYRVLASPPLILAVSLDRTEILTDWWHQVVGSSVLFAALAAMMGVTLAVLFRQIDAEQRARNEMEAASRLKDEFLMTVSHELRTPLTAIYGWARMLNTGTLTDDRRPAALQTIERNARLQTRLIDDLLDMARIIEGKLRLEVRHVDFAEVVRHAVDDARPAAEAKNVHIDVNVRPAAAIVPGDTERLQQIVSNLLGNAIKFSDAGGVVTVDVALRDRTVELVVTDRGVGIAPEFLPYVFDRFRQEHGGAKRRYGGLGLGLAIVRHLVDLHGGTAAADSEGPGRGASFRVRLPVAPHAAATAASQPPAADVQMETS